MPRFCRSAAAFAMAVLVTIAPADDQAPPAQEHPSAEEVNPVEIPEVAYIDPGEFFPEVFRQIVEEPIEDVPLTEALPTIADLVGRPCSIDDEGFEEDKIDREMPVTLRSGLPLHLALDRLCWEASMVHGERTHWFFEDEKVWFTNHDGYWDNMYSRSYEVADLLELFDEDPDSLVSLLQRHNYNAQWLDVDGFGGTIEVRDREFHILQTPGGHREVTANLAGLRSAARTTYVDRSPQIAALREALRRTIDVSVDGLPLQDAIATFADQAQVEIGIIAAYTRNPSINLQQVVKCPLVGESLATTLAATLAGCPEQEFGYYVEFDAIWITAGRRRDTRWETVIYHVSDIIENNDLDKLIETLEQIPEKDPGYFGPRIHLTALPDNRLVITETPSVHEEIAQLFTHLRAEAE